MSGQIISSINQTNNSNIAARSIFGAGGGAGLLLGLVLAFKNEGFLRMLGGALALVGGGAAIGAITGDVGTGESIWRSSTEVGEIPISVYGEDEPSNSDNGSSRAVAEARRELKEGKEIKNEISSQVLQAGKRNEISAKKQALENYRKKIFTVKTIEEKRKALLEISKIDDFRTDKYLAEILNSDADLGIRIETAKILIERKQYETVMKFVKFHDECNLGELEKKLNENRKLNGREKLKRGINIFGLGQDFYDGSEFDLVKKWKTDNDELRVEILERLNGTQHFLEFIEAQIHHPSPIVKQAVQELKNEKADLLLTLLEREFKSRPNIQEFIIKEIGLIESKKAYESLTKIAQDESLPEKIRVHVLNHLPLKEAVLLIEPFLNILNKYNGKNYEENHFPADKELQVKIKIESTLDELIKKIRESKDTNMILNLENILKRADHNLQEQFVL